VSMFRTDPFTKGVIKRYDPDPKKGGNGDVIIIDEPKK